MSARLRVPLVLAAIAVALGAYIGLVDRHRATTDEARTTRLQLIPGRARARITAIEIDRGPRGRVTLSPGAAAELLDAIDAAEIDREATAEASAAGLDPPGARLLITTDATAPRATYEVEIGARDASGRGLFVRRAGDPRIWVTSGGHLLDLIDRDPTGRDR